MRSSKHSGYSSLPYQVLATLFSEVWWKVSWTVTHKTQIFKAACLHFDGLDSSVLNVKHLNPFSLAALRGLKRNGDGFCIALGRISGSLFLPVHPAAQPFTILISLSRQPSVSLRSLDCLRLRGLVSNRQNTLYTKDVMLVHRHLLAEGILPSVSTSAVLQTIPVPFVKTVDSTHLSSTSHREGTPLWGCMDSIPCCGTRTKAAQALLWKAAWHAACLLRLAAWCSMANQHVLKHRLHGLGWNWPPNVPFQEKKRKGLIKRVSLLKWSGQKVSSLLCPRGPCLGRDHPDGCAKRWARLALDPRLLQPSHPLCAAQEDAHAHPFSQPQLWLWGQKMPSS